jgi:hypothetical protein
MREYGMPQGGSEGGNLISTDQRATFGLTPTLSRQREREKEAPQGNLFVYIHMSP